MASISQKTRYYPHELNTKFYATKLYRNGYSIAFVCRRYKISKSSLMHWNRKFDGTKESLVDKSHKSLSPHPNAHTEKEIKWIKDLIKRNPHISMSELYGKLRTEKGYSRTAPSLFRVLRKMGFYINKEQSAYSTVDFVKRAILYFGYQSKIIQTDNGQEFTYLKNTSKIHPLDILLNNLDIKHQLIRPRTPRHNGEDLKIQMKRYLNRSNNIPMQVFGWLSPIQKRYKINEAKENLQLQN